ncbi:hypothetical protein [Scytonema hofmannii]|nr:hypothetical protein [Scytonema hofmannii]
MHQSRVDEDIQTDIYQATLLHKELAQYDEFSAICVLWKLMNLN